MFSAAGGTSLANVPLTNELCRDLTERQNEDASKDSTALKNEGAMRYGSLRFVNGLWCVGQRVAEERPHTPSEGGRRSRCLPHHFADQEVVLVFTGLCY